MLGNKLLKEVLVYSVGRFYSIMIIYKGGVVSRQQQFHMSKGGKTCSQNPLLKAVKMFDLFSFEKFIRFKKEDQFKTTTGGICSIILIVLFVVLFSSTAIKTFRKDDVNYQIVEMMEDEPLRLGGEQAEKFQFAVGIQGANLLDLPAYFSVQLWAKVSQRGKLVSQKEYNLQPCRRETFGPVSESIDDVFDQLQMNQWLCLPPNVTLELNGTNSGQKLTYAEITVVRCNKSRSACVDDSEIDRYITQNGDFILKVYFTNPSINPGEKEYLGYYLDDTNEYPFSNKIGVNANLFFSHYTINTDDSILPQPFSSRKVENGSFVDGNLDAVKNYMVDSNVYARVALRKSTKSVVYERSFRRVDDTLSYIGGLFGGLVMLMIFMKKYNEYAFNLQLAGEMVHHKGESIQEERFNIFKYPAFLVYKFVTYFKEQWGSKWPLFQKYDECCEEMEHQLSIDYLLKRVMFLEKVMELNFSKEYFEGIVLHEKVDLKMMKQKREQYDNHELIKTELEKTINRSNRQLNSSSPLAEECRGRPSPTSIRSFGSVNVKNQARSRRKAGSNYRVRTENRENVDPNSIDETEINFSIQNETFVEQFGIIEEVIEESCCSSPENSPKVKNFQLNPSPSMKNRSDTSRKDKSESGGKRQSAKKQNFVHPFN